MGSSACGTSTPVCSSGLKSRCERDDGVGVGWGILSGRVSCESFLFIYLLAWKLLPGHPPNNPVTCSNTLLPLQGSGMWPLWSHHKATAGTPWLFSSCRTVPPDDCAGAAPQPADSRRPHPVLPERTVSTVQAPPFFFPHLLAFFLDFFLVITATSGLSRREYCTCFPNGFPASTC